METTFKKVHTGKDLAISAIVIIAGIGLFFAHKALGITVAACGLAMLLICKGGYRKGGQGPVLTKTSEDICKGCKASIAAFLDGTGSDITLKKGNEGGSVRLDVYYNSAESIAYAQLFDFRNYTYEPLTDIVELTGDRAHKLIALL